MQLCSTVTFGVIAYNEQKYLPDLLADLLAQSYTKKLIEVILVDGKSSDTTKAIMEEFKSNNEREFRKITILDNEKRVQPAGWNIVLSNATSDIILRIDAHARIPSDFIEKNIKCINSGEAVCGGPRQNIIDEKTPWKELLLLAEQSMFGSGIASYRKSSDRVKYVKSVFHGAYRKEVIKKVGLFNENLIRTEDNEYHYRIRKNGYKICYSPEIRSEYQTRSSLKGMLKQKYLNGFWIGRTLFKCPGCISVFHLVPFMFVDTIILTAVIAVFGYVWPLKLLMAAYAVANLSITALTIVQCKNNRLLAMCLPVIFLLLHLCYGVGTLNGVFKELFSILTNNNCDEKEIVQKQ